MTTSNPRRGSGESSAGRPASGGALTLDEIRAVLHTAAQRRNGARWAVALRQSEVLALRWTDIDLDTATLSVNRTIHRVTGVGLTYAEPKSERSRRRIALPTPLVDALRAHRAAQHAERLKAGTSWHDNNLVFAPAGRGSHRQARRLAPMARHPRRRRSPHRPPPRRPATPPQPPSSPSASTSASSPTCSATPKPASPATPTNTSYPQWPKTPPTGSAQPYGTGSPGPRPAPAGTKGHASDQGK
jgi:hypothetical protein